MFQLVNLKRLLFSKSIIKNIFALMFLRGGNILIQLMLVPISIKYVSPEYYGLWLTISSMITWLNIMDFGLSNGLRNKLTASKLDNDVSLGKVYVSTTYGILALIALVGVIVLGTICYFLNWSNILDIPKGLTDEALFRLLMIVIVAFFLTFFLKPITAIAYSFHKPYIDPLLTFTSSVTNICAITMLMELDSTGNIMFLASVFCFTPIVTNFITSTILFNTKFKDYKPTLELVDLQHARPLMSLSVKFFVIQIAATIVLTTTNFIISHYYGNNAVTEYNIVQRYFSIIITIQAMILVPFWNLITEAYTQNKISWLTSTMKKLFLGNVAFSAITVIMIFAASSIFKIWIGDIVHVPQETVLFFGLYTILFINTSTFTTFINGTGKVKLQMITSVFTCILYIPLIITVVKVFNIGTIGIIASGCLWSLLMLPIRYKQYTKLLQSNVPRNIWNS